MEGQEYYITFVRKEIREFLKSTVSQNNLDIEKAKVIATEVNGSLVQTISTRDALSKVLSNLSGRFPELKAGIHFANQRYIIEKNQRFVDEKIIPLVESNDLDKAIAYLNTISSQ